MAEKEQVEAYYENLEDFQKAVENYKQHLKVAVEVGDKATEGEAYCILGNVYKYLEDYQKAIEYYERDLKISKELGNRAGEGKAYCNLGNAYDNLGNLRKP